jgi:ATP/maltotriose-dependent transcriptional regulator MalT
VTLISAPAGFGKTTLVSEWVAGCKRREPKVRVAWLSLDESDNDPSQFLTSLINEVAATPQDFILVLDDYHLIETQPIHDALTFLLDHLPPQMHLAVASRCDPPLPLARLRGRGELTELRAADLRFTPAEAATFLNQGMGLGLSAEDVTALETRTEGWIVGLQMAALALQSKGRSPCRGEQTSLSQSLRRLLPARLMQEQPDRVTILHQRASAWYEPHDLPAEAVRHALAGADFERTASLVELAWPAMQRRRQEATMLGWVKALPDELIRVRPVLNVVSAWALLDGGELEAAEARLRDAERWLDTAANLHEPPEAPAPETGPERSRRMIVVDEKQFRSLPASIANARAYRAQALGDVPGTVTYARRALDLLPEGDDYERGTTAALLGLAYWANGELEAAHRSFAAGLASLQRGGGLLIFIPRLQSLSVRGRPPPPRPIGWCPPR